MKKIKTLLCLLSLFSLLISGWKMTQRPADDPMPTAIMLASEEEVPNSPSNS